VLFEQLIDSVLRRHNIGQSRAHEQGGVISELSNDLLGDRKSESGWPPRKVSTLLATGKQVDVPFLGGRLTYSLAASSG
jgi:hypothetical protein